MVLRRITLLLIQAHLLESLGDEIDVLSWEAWRVPGNSAWMLDGREYYGYLAHIIAMTRQLESCEIGDFERISIVPCK